MKLLVFLFLFVGLFPALSRGAQKPVQSCASFLAPKKGKEVFQGLVHVSSGRRIYVIFQKPLKRTLKKPVFLLHGLMDSHRRFDQMTSLLLQRGYPVVRMDLFGFGQSLVEELRLHEGNLDFLKDLNYETNVSDLKDVFKWLEKKHNVRDMTVLGHSMGGGLLTAALTDSSLARVVNRVVLVSPYIYRLDRYHTERQLLRPSQVFEKWMPAPLAWMSPVLNSMESALIDRSLDLSDPVMGSHSLNQMLEGQLAGLTDETFKQALLQSTVSTIKGLRGLDLLPLVAQIPSSIEVDQVLLMKDELVPLPLQKKLAESLSQRTRSRFYEIQAGHMAPSQAPQALVEILSPSLRD